jgi:hypothetical protein
VAPGNWSLVSTVRRSAWLLRALHLSAIAR